MRRHTSPWKMLLLQVIGDLPNTERHVTFKKKKHRKYCAAGIIGAVGLQLITYPPGVDPMNGWGSSSFLTALATYYLLHNAPEAGLPLGPKEEIHYDKLEQKQRSPLLGVVHPRLLSGADLGLSARGGSRILRAITHGSMTSHVRGR